MWFIISSLKMFLVLTFRTLNMENPENGENNTTDHLSNPLPTTVELCTLCTQYVFGSGFKKKSLISNSWNVFQQPKKLDTFRVSYDTKK